MSNSHFNSNLSKEDLHSLPGVCANPDVETSSYIFQAGLSGYL